MSPAAEARARFLDDLAYHATWLAMPTSDLEQVRSFMRLGAAVPTPMHAAWSRWVCGPVPHMLVTNGAWTFVFLPRPAFGEGARELSQRFGECHSMDVLHKRGVFGVQRHVDGQLVRSILAEPGAPPQVQGEPHPNEPPLPQRTPFSGEDVLDIARSWGADPCSLYDDSLAVAWVVEPMPPSAGRAWRIAVLLALASSIWVLVWLTSR